MVESAVVLAPATTCVELLHYQMQGSSPYVNVDDACSKTSGFCPTDTKDPLSAAAARNSQAQCYADCRVTDGQTAKVLPLLPSTLLLPVRVLRPLLPVLCCRAHVCPAMTDCQTAKDATCVAAAFFPGGAHIADDPSDKPSCLWLSKCTPLPVPDVGRKQKTTKVWHACCPPRLPLLLYVNC